MSDATLDGTVAYAAPRHAVREIPKWSRRRTLLFTFVASMALWSLIIMTVVRLL